MTAKKRKQKSVFLWGMTFRRVVSGKAQLGQGRARHKETKKKGPTTS